MIAKIIIAVFALIPFQILCAEGKFRFERGEGVTGIPTWVYDEKGVETTIRFSKNSNSQAMFVLDSLLSLEGVWGSAKAKRDTRGITYDQAIFLIGEFVTEERLTPKVVNGPSQQLYREFRVSKIEIGIPFSQWIQRDKDDPISSPYAVLFHLSVESIFPKGLSYEGGALDLRALGSKLDSEQGSAHQSTTRPESKSE